MSKKKNMYNPTLLSDNQIEAVAANLRAVIDEIDKNFANAKSLILELARLLDETKQCEQSQICRKIKELLKDKIKEDMITEKWIEECLPHQYKRKYVKSELTSLSQNETKTKEKVLIDSTRGSSTAKALLPSNSSGSNNDPKFTATKANQNILVADNQETSYQTDCLRCKELEDALLRASTVVPADKLQDENKKYLIPKEKHDLLIAAMKSSQEFCCLIFDKEGTLVYAKPDISGNRNGL